LGAKENLEAERKRERGGGRAGVDLRELGRWKFGC